MVLADAKKSMRCWWEDNSTALAVAFLVNVFAFLIFITHFMLTNHTPRFPWLDPLDQVHAARWFTPVTISALYSANLPVLSHLFSITTYLLGGLFAFQLWWGRGTSTERSLFLLSLTLFPTSLVIFHYTWMGHQYAVAILLGAFALTLAAKGSISKVCISAILITLAMASYQAVLSVIATLYVAYLSLHWSRLNLASARDRRLYLNKVLNIGIPILVGALLYRVSLPMLGLSEAKVVNTVDLNDLWARCVEVVVVSFEHLTLTQPELSLLTKQVLLCFVVVAGLILICRSIMSQSTVALSIFSGIVGLVIFAATIVATKAMFIISSSADFYTYRFNFSLAFFYAFCMFVVLRCSREDWLKALILLSITVLCLRYAQANLVRQNILLKGQQHDIALTNRIIARIESHPDFVIGKEYIFIRTGRLSLFRRQAMRSEGYAPDHPGDIHMTFGDIPGGWTPASLMPLLGSKIKFKHEGYIPNFSEEIKIAREVAVQRKMELWPHSSSILIEGNKIYLHIN